MISLAHIIQIAFYIILDPRSLPFSTVGILTPREHWTIFGEIIFILGKSMGIWYKEARDSAKKTPVHRREPHPTPTHEL